MAKNDYFSKTIGGRTFIAAMSDDGPYIRVDDRVGEGDVVLGVHTSIWPVDDEEDSFAICKYTGGQPRIMLPGFSDEDIRAVAAAFGIESPVLDIEADPFECEAFTALREWVEKHPRIAKSYESCDTYLRGWYRHATEPRDETPAPGL